MGVAEKDEIVQIELGESAIKGMAKTTIGVTVKAIDFGLSRHWRRVKRPMGQLSVG